MRFHFNAHNLLAYGRDGDEYLISDPVLEEAVRCRAEALQKARFAKGALAAKGLIYWVDDVPLEHDWEKLIRQSLLGTTRILDGMPLPWIGIRGIQHLARQVEQLDPAQAKYNRLPDPHRAHAGRDRHRRRRLPLHVRQLPAGGRREDWCGRAGRGIKAPDRHRRRLAPVHLGLRARQPQQGRGAELRPSPKCCAASPARSAR